MEQKISFIPKKNLTPGPNYRSEGMDFFLMSSLVLIVISGLLFGGSYIYKKALDGELAELNDSLQRAEERLNLSFIERAKTIDEKIKAAKLVLSGHSVATPVFKFLEESTLQKVRFSNFSLAYPKTKDQSPSVNMSGVSKGYTSLALQSREFKKSQYLEDVFFSSFSLTPAGDVNFSVNILFDPAFLIYRAE